jgi:drug/metabolite transporter, DME family
VIGSVNTKSTDAPDRRTFATWAAVGAAVLFGTTGTSQELLPDTATPLGVGGVRLVIGATVLVVITGILGRLRVHEIRRGAATIVFGGIAVAAYQVTFFLGTDRTGVATGTLLALGSGPLAAGAIHWARTNVPPTRRWSVVSAVAVLGVSLLVGGAPEGTSSVGIASAIVAGISYAVYATTVADLIGRGFEPFGAMAATFGAGAVFILPFTVTAPLGWVIEPRGVVVALHLGVVTVAVAYALYAWSLVHLPVAHVVTLTLAEPVTATLLGLLVLGQEVAPVGWLGITLVVVSLALLGRTSSSVVRTPPTKP